MLEDNVKTENGFPIPIVLMLFFFIMIIPFIMRNEVLYARNLEVTGVVSSIEWKSSNHQLPEIVIVSEVGEKTVLSHSSIALNESTIRANDKIEKKEGDNYCLKATERQRTT